MVPTCVKERKDIRDFGIVVASTKDADTDTALRCRTEDIEEVDILDYGQREGDEDQEEERGNWVSARLIW